MMAVDEHPATVRTLPAGWTVIQKPRFAPPRLIGFHGPAGCGKDLAASMIPDSAQVGFADAIYAGLAAMLCVAEAELRGRSRKELPIVLNGKPIPSPRRLLQTLGTDWGRDSVDADLWVTLAELRWHDAWPVATTVTVPDVRFMNEARAIRAAGGEVWRILRDVEPIAPHVSETALPDSCIDRVIPNFGTVAEFKANVLEAYLAACMGSGGSAQPSTGGE